MAKKQARATVRRGANQPRPALSPRAAARNEADRTHADRAARRRNDVTVHVPHGHAAQQQEPMEAEGQADSQQQESEISRESQLGTSEAAAIRKEVRHLGKHLTVVQRNMQTSNKELVRELVQTTGELALFCHSHWRWRPRFIAVKCNRT